MDILITGSTGLVGSSLTAYLTEGGHTVRRMVRRSTGLAADEVSWDPSAGRLDPASLSGLDAVIHLAGENIAGGRWTAGRKRRILQSRVQGTRLLAESIGRVAKPPRVLISASAIGYYGDRGDEILREDSGRGTGFLAGLCQEWEQAAHPVADYGVRLVILRIGVVLSAKGGALARMLLPFRMGVGGRIGSGRQYMSWIALDDLVGTIEYAVGNDSLRGPVNAVSPSAVTNEEFTRTLGKVLSRPTIFPLPAFAARMALGEMADELLLYSARVEPSRLLNSSFPFQHSDLRGALRHILGR